MALLSFTDVSLAYGHVPLLARASFSVEGGERVALIGRNGTGKSSMLKLIAGLEKPDTGEIVMRQGLRRAYVPQEPVFDPTRTVFEAVSDGAAEARDLREQYEAVSVQAALGSAHDLAVLLDALQSKIEALDAWRWEQRVHEALERLKLPPDAVMQSLSGGTQKRVALARALVAAPDLLLLDEPTNHLDLDGIAWLEELLNNQFKGTTMLVTHDRAFLDAVATRVVELDRAVLRSYPGRYAAYEQTKAAELNAESLASAREDKLLAQEEVWVRQGVEARRTRSVGRVKRLEALRAQRAARREQVGAIKLQVDAGLASGRLVVELEKVSKQYGARTIVRELSATILRGDRVGVIGPNGVGKTTLLKLMLGDVAPDQGRVRLGTRLQVAYFDQMRTALDLEATLADTISASSEWVEVGGQRKHVMSYLSDFLFSPARANAPVKTLSGGERHRLLLARLFARPANVLVLDEPTNDLDIETLELLESLLQSYPGTVFLVSHDRRFLNNVVTSTLVAEGEGRWREYEGDVDDWLRQSARSHPATGAEAQAAGEPTPKTSLPDTQASAKAPTPAAAATPPARRGLKLSFKEQRELDAMPARIESLEAEQASLSAQMEQADFYAQTPPAQVAAVLARHAAIEDELMQCLERWDALTKSP